MSAASARITILIPAFNEASQIGRVIADIRKNGYTSVVVVDDGSTDTTSAVAKQAGATVLRHAINLGQGAALQTGFEYCQKRNADIVVTFDADGQFCAGEIQQVIQPILDNKADIVLGSRFLGKAIAISRFRKLLLQLGIIFTWVFSGVWLTDTHNGFRSLSKKALSCISLSHNGMAHASEIIDQMVQHKLRLEEVAVTVLYSAYAKQKGQKSLNSFRIITSLLFDRFQ